MSIKNNLENIYDVILKAQSSVDASSSSPPCFHFSPSFRFFFPHFFAFRGSSCCSVSEGPKCEFYESWVTTASFNLSYVECNVVSVGSTYTVIHSFARD
jgi:hypothetical protein